MGSNLGPQRLLARGPFLQGLVYKILADRIVNETGGKVTIADIYR
jgi:hypothetical protein